MDIDSIILVWLIKTMSSVSTFRGAIKVSVCQVQLEESFSPFPDLVTAVIQTDSREHWSLYILYNIKNRRKMRRKKRKKKLLRNTDYQPGIEFYQTKPQNTKVPYLIPGQRQEISWIKSFLCKWKNLSFKEEWGHVDITNFYVIKIFLPRSRNEIQKYAEDKLRRKHNMSLQHCIQGNSSN